MSCVRRAQLHNTRRACLIMKWRLAGPAYEAGKGADPSIVREPLRACGRRTHAQAPCGTHIRGMDATQEPCDREALRPARHFFLRR